MLCLCCVRFDGVNSATPLSALTASRFPPSALQVPVLVNELGVDFATVVGHKFGAPKGCAALYVRRGNFAPSASSHEHKCTTDGDELQLPQFPSLIFGGGQVRHTHVCMYACMCVCAYRYVCVCSSTKECIFVTHAVFFFVGIYLFHGSVLAADSCMCIQHACTSLVFSLARVPCSRLAGLLLLSSSLLCFIAQEMGRRAGTENVMLAVALGAAAQLVVDEVRCCTVVIDVPRGVVLKSASVCVRVRACTDPAPLLWHCSSLCSCSSCGSCPPRALIWLA